MKLQDCTKKELLFVIRTAKKYGLGSFDFAIDRALNDLEYQREKSRIKKAEELSKVAHDARMEYIEILSPYDGKRLIDIPEDVLVKADQARQKAQKADEQWMKLMKI